MTLWGCAVSLKLRLSTRCAGSFESGVGQGCWQRGLSSCCTCSTRYLRHSSCCTAGCVCSWCCCAQLWLGCGLRLLCVCWLSIVSLSLVCLWLICRCCFCISFGHWRCHMLQGWWQAFGRRWFGSASATATFAGRLASSSTFSLLLCLSLCLLLYRRPCVVTYHLPKCQ